MCCQLFKVALFLLQRELSGFFKKWYSARTSRMRVSPFPHPRSRTELLSVMASFLFIHDTTRFTLPIPNLKPKGRMCTARLNSRPVNLGLILLRLLTTHLPPRHCPWNFQALDNKLHSSWRKTVDFVEVDTYGQNKGNSHRNPKSLMSSEHWKRRGPSLKVYRRFNWLII